MRTRLFDYEEARRLRASGLTYLAIGELLGVSRSAVYLACNAAARELSIRKSAEWTRNGTCVDCGGRCTRGAMNPSSRCWVCRALLQGTSARDGELSCVRCKEWKPDEAFPHNRTEKYARRGRHTSCRACQAEMRQESRLRRRVPCKQCGKLRSHPKERGRNHGPDSGLCLHCYHANRRVAA